MRINSLPFTSVIIPVFNDSVSLSKCLQSLELQTYSKDSYEVIVVDNASDEDIKAVVDQFSQATLVYESQQGSYVARNKGISIAKGSVIAFTDSDCVPALDWIEQGVRVLIDKPGCGLVAGKIAFTFRDPKTPNVIELCDSVLHLQQEFYLKDSKFGATANVFTFKKVFDRVGNFDQSLKSGGDYDWGQKVFLAGYQQVYSDLAYVNHPARYSYDELYKKITRTAKGSADLSTKNNHSWVLLKTVARDLKPPLKTFSRIGTDNIWLKIRVISTILFLKYLTAYERIKSRFVLSL